MGWSGIHVSKMAEFDFYCNSVATASGPMEPLRRRGLSGSGWVSRRFSLTRATKLTVQGIAAMSTADTTSLPTTFNRLAWSNLAAQSAEQIALAAAPIVAVLLLGGGEGQTGLLQTALTLPFILFAIPAGLLADRISRRWVMTGSEALRAAALIAILMLIGLDLLTLH